MKQERRPPRYTTQKDAGGPGTAPYKRGRTVIMKSALRIASLSLSSTEVDLERRERKTLRTLRSLRRPGVLDARPREARRVRSVRSVEQRRSPSALWDSG